MRIGIVGAGEVAVRHIEGLLAAGAAIAGVAEPVEERRRAFQEKHGVPLGVSDYRLLLASSEIDTVLILTPHALHVSMAVEALRAGKHVICEKPMATSTEDCDRMLEAARSSKRALLVTHSLREDFFCRFAIERVRAGGAGRLIAGSFRWFTDELARLEAPGNWKGTKQLSGGGVLIDGGCHVADLANALFGRARRVHAFGRRLVATRDAVAEDTASLSIEYESGAIVSCLLSFTAGSNHRGPGGFSAGMFADIHGTEAHIEGGYWIREGAWRRWAIERRGGEPDRAHEPDEPVRLGQIDFALVRALRGEAPPPLTALDARNAVAVVDAAYLSLATDRVAEVDWRDDAE